MVLYVLQMVRVDQHVVIISQMAMNNVMVKQIVMLAVNISHDEVLAIQKISVMVKTTRQVITMGHVVRNQQNTSQHQWVEHVNMLMKNI